MNYNNKEYIEFGKEIINIISKETGGFAQTYFVGACVRDIILNRPIKDVYLFTTANNDQLLNMFKRYQTLLYDNETVRLIYKEYVFYISTYKMLVQKQVRKIENRHYNTALMDYLERRDFLIDSLAMSYSNQIIDPFDGRSYLKKKRISVYGNAKVSFNDSPIRIIKAIGLVSQLGYSLDRNVCRGIKKRKKLLSNISDVVIALEFKDIINGKYFKKAINLLDDMDVCKKIPVFKYELNRLANRFKKETVDEFLINVMVKNGEIDYNILKAADNQEFVKNVVNLAIANLKADYDELTLFRNGLDVCLAANKSNHLWKKSKNKSRKIKKAFDKLPIKSTCDLAFKGQDILEITKDDGGKYLEELIDNIEASVLLGELKNEYEAIKVYVYRRLYEIKKHVGLNSYVKEDEPEIKTECYEEIKTEKNNDDINYEDDFFGEEIVETNTVTNKTNEENVFESKELDAEFKEKMNQINIKTLEEKLNKHIDDLIKQSNILDEMKGNDAIDTYNRMKKRYREALIEKYPEYSILKDKYND